MAGSGRTSTRLWLAFALSSLACLVVLAVSPIKDYLREYRHYQDGYRAQLLASASTSKELALARAENVRIRQIWIPALGDQVDRCISCHLGVENPKFAAAAAPYRSHPLTPHTPGDFARFGCVACHRGQGRATSLAEAHGTVADWSSPLLPLRYTEAACGTCHRGLTVPEAALLSAGRGLMNRLGCLGCHRIESFKGWRSQAPDLEGLADKTHVEWLKAWLRRPRDLRPATWMPDFHLSDEEIEGLVAFLWAQPASRPLPLAVEGDLAAGDLERGKKTFRESRCISCHTIEGRGNGSASELSGIGSKVNRRWLVAFLGDPQSFRPEIAMPRYDFSRQQLLDISTYMAEELVDPSAPAAGAAYRASAQQIAAGEEVFVKYGCSGCHHIAGRKDAAPIGPDLTIIGAKSAELLDFGTRRDLPHTLPDWLAAKVSHPRSFREGLRMPEFGLDPGQIEALVTALLSYDSLEVPEAYRVETTAGHYRPPGRFGQLVGQYRCLSCHQMQGVGGDISTAPLTAEGSKVQESWLKAYLLLPTAIRPILTDRMLPLQMSEERAGFLANFMANAFVDDGIPGEIFPEGPTPEQAARGQRLFYERYGCQSCHQIGGSGGYYGPPLDDAPTKLRSGWIAWWLQGPQRWRSDVRCPDFGLGADDARDLAAFLATPRPAAAKIGSRP